MNKIKIGFSRANLTDCMSLVVAETKWAASTDGSLEKKFDISDRVKGIWRPVKGETRKLVAHPMLSVMTGTDDTGERWILIALDQCELSYQRIDSIKKPLKELFNIKEERIICMPSHCHINVAINEDQFRKLLLETVSSAIEQESETETAFINLEIDAEHFVVNRRVNVDGLGTRTIMFNDNCVIEDDGMVVTEQIKEWIRNLGGKTEDLLAPGQEIRTSKKVDKRLQLLLFRNKENKSTMGSVVRFACHPVIVSEKKANGDISADYPGYLRERLEEYLGGGVTLFAQGQSGDLRPLIKEYSHAFAKEYGYALANKLISAIHANTVWDEVNNCIYDSESCNLPLRNDFPTNEKDAASKLKEIEINYDQERDIYKRRKLQNLYWFFYRWKVTSLVRPEWFKQGFAPLKIYGLKINEHALIANHAELFSDTGKRMCEGFEPHSPIMVGICNEELSYIPSLEDFERGGYEPSVCMTEPGATEIVIKASQKLLSRFFQK